MDRTEFCSLFAKIKENRAVKWLELIIATHTDRSNLIGVFNGKTNFFVETAIKIAQSIGALIVLKKGQEQIELNSPTTLTWWAKKSQQESGLSVNKFKDEIGMSRVAVTANLKGESKMRIDTLLKWAEITGYSVEVWTK